MKFYAVKPEYLDLFQCFPESRFPESDIPMLARGWDMTEDAVREMLEPAKPWHTYIITFEIRRNHQIYHRNYRFDAHTADEAAQEFRALWQEYGHGFPFRFACRRSHEDGMQNLYDPMYTREFYERRCF